MKIRSGHVITFKQSVVTRVKDATPKFSSKYSTTLHCDFWWKMLPTSFKSTVASCEHYATCMTLDTKSPLFSHYRWKRWGAWKLGMRLRVRLDEWEANNCKCSVCVCVCSGQVHKKTSILKDHRLLWLTRTLQNQKHADSGIYDWVPFYLERFHNQMTLSCTPL